MKFEIEGIKSFANGKIRVFSVLADGQPYLLLRDLADTIGIRRNHASAIFSKHVKLFSEKTDFADMLKPDIVPQLLVCGAYSDQSVKDSRRIIALSESGALKFMGLRKPNPEKRAAEQAIFAKLLSGYFHFEKAAEKAAANANKHESQKETPQSPLRIERQPQAERQPQTERRLRAERPLRNPQRRLGGTVTADVLTEDLLARVYEKLESVAHCVLRRRLSNLMGDLIAEGANPEDVGKLTKIDVIERDSKLKRLFYYLVVEELSQRAEKAEKAEKTRDLQKSA